MSDFCETVEIWAIFRFRKNIKLIKHKHVTSGIILKHVIWRLQIYNLFREMFKFRDFEKAFVNFAKLLLLIFPETNYNILMSKSRASK